MENSCIVCAVLTNFERFGNAVLGESMKPVLAGILCSVRQKSLTKFRLAGQFNRVPTNRAFFVFAAPSAIAANLNGLPERIHRLIGSPLIASLAAFVNRLHNLSISKRQKELIADKFTRSAQLSWQQNQATSGAVVKSLYPLLPL